MANNFTEADGRRLAVDMLVEMKGVAFGRSRGIGLPQVECLTRYLQKAREHPAVEAGFIAALADVIVDAASAGHWPKAFLELIERGPSGPLDKG